MRQSFFAKILGAFSPKTRGWIQKQLPTEKMVRKSSIHVLIFWWRSVYARQCETKIKRVFVFLFLSRWVWPILVSQTRRDVWHVLRSTGSPFIGRFSRGVAHFLEEET